EDIQEVAAVPDGSSLIALTRTGSLHRLPLDAKAESAESAPAARIVHLGRVYDAHWSDPQTLITAGGDGHLGRSVLAGDSAQAREISGVRARDVAVSPDGALIVWWSFEKLGLYDLVKDEHLF